MGYLIENGIFKWKREGDKWVKELIFSGLNLTESFRNGLRFHKANISFKCGECQEQKSKNTRYLGEYYEKICVDCAIKWIEGSIKTFNEAIGLLREAEEDLSINKEKWRREQILGAIIGDKD